MDDELNQVYKPQHIELIGFLDRQNVRELQYLSERLQELRDYVPNTGYGICYNLSIGYGHLFDEICKYWPKHSGDVAYPIPGGAYAYRSGKLDHSLWEGNQLQLRQELMMFVIGEIEQFLHTNHQNDLTNPAISFNGDY